MTEAPKKSSLLRAAIEALGQGNHAEAVRCCKHALKLDRQNYDAFVVLGKSLYASKQFEQAEISYRRAADIKSSDARAWQGLAELCEAMNDYEKVIEACNNVIRIFQSKGDLTHLADYIRRLAKAHAALQDYQNALHAWENILHMESVSNSLRLEALCGVVDSKYILMEQWIEKNTNLQLSQDKMLDASSAKQIAENQFTNSQDGLDLEETLWGLLKEIPTNEKYETILLQYLIWKMRVNSLDKGEKWHKCCLQVLQLCLSAFSWHASSLATIVLLALCEEDTVNDLFSEMGMLELAQGRMTRLNYLGKRLVHAYPDQVLLMPVLAYLMHQSSSCSRSLLQKRSLCERAIQLNENSVLGWQVLAELWASEGAYSNANDCIRRGLHAINELRSSFGLSLQCAEMELRLAFGEIHLKTGNYDEASKVYHNIINVAEQKKDDKFTQVLVPAKEGQIKVLLAQGHVEEAANGLIALLSLDNQNSWALAEQGYLAYEKKDFEKAGTLLQQAVTLNPTCAKYHHRLGLVYWNLNNAKEKALSHFMESAKLDPNQSEVFCMLGHYYKDFPVSRGRAIRCYQKAITVNCEDSEAGEALCDLLDSESQEISEVNICQEASGRSPRAFWAFRRLGYIQVSRKEWTEAVKNLQHAVRGYPASPDLWEALGLAYQQLGMLTAALKAYGRVLTINEGSLYALQQSGNILQTLGMYRKAVSMFQDAVEKSPEHPASLYGLASALHSQAHECRSKGAVQWSASLLKEASLVASRGLSICRNIGCFWKLLGDIEISYARNLPWELKQCVLDEDRISRTIDQSKILHSFALSLNAWREERLSAALKSKRAYQHALHLQPHKAYIYADLCSCLHYIANLTDDKKSKCSILTESMAYNGLAVDGNNTNLWTLLGIVSKNHAIQQHAFIQALHVDGNHALAWAKLGQLYSKVNDMELAEEAFTRARSADAMLGLTWAAMCNMNRDAKSPDAFANILYASQLTPVASFQLGLAKVSAVIKQLDSPQVFAAIEQAVLQAPDLPEVHNYMGLAYELQRNFSSAVRAFSMSKAAVEFGSLGMKPSSVHLMRQATSLNLARALCKAGDFQSAVEQFEMLAKEGNLEDSNSLRSYAIALWQSDKQKLAVSIAKVAIKKSVQNGELSAAICLLLKFSYHLSGPAAALQDIHSGIIELHTDTTITITTTALSILVGESNVVFEQLLQLTDNYVEDNADELFPLLAAGLQMHRDDESACHLLQKALHIYPQCLAIRSKLMRLLLERSNGLEAHVAARCCSLEISRFQISISTNQANEAASATAVACSACGNIKPQASFSSCNSNYHFMKDTIKGLQRWIHSEPWNIMSQYHLVLALLQQAREQRFPVHMCRSIQRLIETVLARMSANDCEPSQIVDHAHLQMLLCKSEVSLQTGGLESALQSASKASELNIPQNLAAVPWLQLTRCHISSGNSFLANANLSKAVNLKAVDFPTFLCILDLTSTLEEDITLKLERMEILDIKGKNSHIVKALIEWKKAEICIRQRDLPLAEAAASKSVASWPEEKSLHLFHGAICMELLNHGWSSVNLTDTCRRLMKATRGDGKCLPIAGLLLAQVQENKAGTPGWERLLRMEWNLWPADMKPAELYFQMGVLARVSKTSGSIPSSKLWFQRAVHVNPSCGSYWKVLVPSEGNDMLK